MRGWWPLVAVCLGSFLFLLDSTVVTVALPDVAADLGASLGDLQWVANAYTLVLAALMLAAGSVADRFGHRATYLAGLAVFAVASLGCGLAPDPMTLIAARAVQGVGGAAIAVSGIALLGGHYTGRALGTAMGVWGAVSGAGAAAGPPLGGLVTQWLDWRAVFLLNLPVAAATVAVTVRAVRAGRGRTGGRPDPFGVAAFALGTGSLTWALTRAGTDGFGSPPVLAGLALAAAGLVAFVIRQARRARSAIPLLDLALFRRPRFTVVMVCVLASSAAFACLLYTSVWLQSGLRLGPVRAGLALAPLALTTLVVSVVGGRLLHRVPTRFAMGVGLLLSGAGCALQAGLDARSTAGSIALGLVVTGAGVGLLVPTMGVAVMSAVPPDRRGMGAGAMTTFRQYGQTLGVAAFGLLFRSGPAASARGLDRVYLAAAVVGVAAGLLALAALPSAPSAAPAAGRAAERDPAS